MGEFAFIATYVEQSYIEKQPGNMFMKHHR